MLRPSVVVTFRIKRLAVPTENCPKLLPPLLPDVDVVEEATEGIVEVIGEPKEEIR